MSMLKIGSFRCLLQKSAKMCLTKTRVIPLNRFNTVRFSSSDSEVNDVKTKTPDNIEVGQIDSFGNRCLYLHREKAFSVRQLFSLAGMSGSVLMLHMLSRFDFLFGLEVLTSQYWAPASVFFTGLFTVMSHQLAHGAVLQAYESEDGKRIGFQMHTIFGYPGRKVEVSVGNAWMIYPKGKYSSEEGEKLKNHPLVKLFPPSTNIPVVVNGLAYSVFLDEKAQFTEDHRLMDLLNHNRVQEEKIEATKQKQIEYNNQIHKFNKRGKNEKYSKPDIKASNGDENEEKGVPK